MALIFGVLSSGFWGKVASESTFWPPWSFKVPTGCGPPPSAGQRQQPRGHHLPGSGPLGPRHLPGGLRGGSAAQVFLLLPDAGRRAALPGPGPGPGTPAGPLGPGRVLLPAAPQPRARPSLFPVPQVSTLASVSND